MNKKGFTLIELLAVTIILGLMVLVVMPNLLSAISDMKEREKTILRDRLESAAIVYAENNKNDIPELKKVNGVLYITLGDLVDSGLLDTPIIDPSTDAEIPLSTYIKITKTTSNKFAVVFDVLLPSAPPVITITGSNPASVDKGSTYTDAGATAASIKDGNLTSSIVKTGTVNTAAVGTYIIVYTVTDSFGTTVSEQRTVNVIMPPPPPANFAYTGAAQTYSVTLSGTYKLEVWGAQGGQGYYNASTIGQGGNGAYAKGEITLNAGETLSVYVGGKGTDGTSSTTYNGGYNGGGQGITYAGGGGGATDIRRSGTALANRIIVAGGGGGGQAYSGAPYISNGGYGGGTTGGNATHHSYWTASGTYISSGGSQSAGGTTTSGWNGAGALGLGGNYYSSQTYLGGGGAGYYGGAAGAYLGGSGAGGSSYIGTLSSVQMIAGNISMPAPAGGAETGHTGNGYARITYMASPSNTDYVASKGVNKPKLITGMTPIKWNGSAWVDTTEGDAAWYDYTTGAKQWANAKTADGSMWVWIPRYAYQIATNYHTATVGTINIKFLQNNTNAMSDGDTVAITPTYSGSAQTNYIQHSAFTFGTSELTGIWVAKFEASVANTSDACYTTENATNCNKTTLIPKIVPNVKSWRYISNSNIFTVVRSMETNSTYGWGATGAELDSHLMKNTEWGAVTYLTQSVYGKNSEIWINNSSVYTTGCAGSSVSAASYAGCQNAYDTATGLNASTTGNIYGIYDMSGGSFECTAAHVNNGHANLATNGNSIITAISKYKDVYTVTTDSNIDNYNNASSNKGDAVYETSLTYGGSNAWNGDSSGMPSINSPWFVRGGINTGAAGAGAFYFHVSSGAPDSGSSFRIVLSPKS